MIVLNIKFKLINGFLNFKFKPHVKKKLKTALIELSGIFSFVFVLSIEILNLIHGKGIGIENIILNIFKVVNFKLFTHKKMPLI